MQEIRNIGIVAHVDAGKTTITEGFLHMTGALREKGSVDKGTAQTDSLEIERQRGISVKAALTAIQWKDCKINIIDSPGHADFASEVERSLMAMDAAVLVINAVDGVQGQTSILWKALQQRNMPVIIFVNKIDRAGADVERVLSEIRKELSKDILPLQEVIDEGMDTAEIAPKSLMRSMQVDYDEEKIEFLASYSEPLFERYMNDDIPGSEELHELTAWLCSKGEIFPVLFGSAKHELGLKELLDGIRELFPAPKIVDSNKLSAVVYHISHDKKLGKMAGVRMFGGDLKIRDSVLIAGAEEETKINQIRISKEGKIENVNEIEAGDVGLISGLGHARIGDYLGIDPGVSEHSSMSQPLLSTQVLPEDESMIADLAKALTELSNEDPELDFVWFKEENELQLKIMGWMQLDALKFMLEDRYAMKVQFEQPSVIYKETPKTEGIGYERYTMPKPCWAVVKFEISPGERGSGWIYESRISVDKVHQKYQNEVDRTIPHALKQGIKGWEVTDLKIALIDGEDHEIHSRPGDFILATKVGLMEGLSKIDTSLLEPILSFTISAPEEMLGKVVSDITQMRGSFETPDIIGDRFEMKGLLPLASSMDYSVKLTSRSGGKARIFTQFHSYQPCSDEEGVVREYKGLSPLNRGKYILQHRGAIQ